MGQMGKRKHITWLDLFFRGKFLARSAVYEDQGSIGGPKIFVKPGHNMNASA
jgi:hypothetical protein